MTFPPCFRYKGLVCPVGTRFALNQEVPVMLRPKQPLCESVVSYEPDGWQLNVDKEKHSDAIPFDEWIKVAREYQTRFPYESQPPALPSTPADLPTGTVFVLHIDQPFALTPPSDLSEYEIFSHVLGPYRGRPIKDINLTSATDISIEEWFSLAEESERKAYADRNPDLVLSEPLNPSYFSPGTRFYLKEWDVPIVMDSNGKTFNWNGGHPREWQEYCGSAHVIPMWEVPFDEWLAVYEESVRENQERAANKKRREDGQKGTL